MGRALITIRTDEDRTQARQWVTKAPVGTEIEFRRDMRNKDQNAAMWAALTDISEQVEWYGQWLTPTDWKDVCTASLSRAQVVPGIEPGTVVTVGLSTSKMTKEEMSNLLELIMAFGAEHGVIFHDAESRAAL